MKKLSVLLFLLLSINLNAQGVNKIKINPEILKKIIENRNTDFVAFSVSLKEVDSPLYETNKLASKKINDLQNKHEEVKSIILKIDEFLNSKDSYDVKKNYLIDAQSIADKHKLECVIKKDNSLKSSIAGDFGIKISNAPSYKIIYIYKSNKRTNENDLELYKNYVNKILLEISKEYKDSNLQLNRLNSISENESDAVFSDENKRKQIYILKDTLSIGYDKIDGTFLKIDNQFKIVLKNISNKFIKNQIINENEYSYDRTLFSKPCSLIRKVDTDEYFVIMSDNFFLELEQEKMNNEIFDIIHKLGYKEYKDESGDYFIKSKVCEIRLNTWTLNELKLNPAYINTLDNDQIKLASLVKQTIPHSKILDKYCGIYIIQRNRMSTNDIKNWRIATVNAMKLNDGIYKILEKYAGDYSFTLLNKSNTFEEFTDVILASKGVLKI